MRKSTAFPLLSLLLLIALTVPLSAQSNQAIDRLLDEKQATFGDAAYLVLAAGKLIPEESTPEEAAAAVTERKLLPQARDPASPATLGEVSYLIMETQGVRGGLFFTLFPGPRYAARELAFMHIIKGNAHPSRPISGEEVMRILAAVIEKKGEK